ncbi:MAG: HYR domain-containing protein, partial [Desulfuromonadales bacterium]
ATWNNTPGGDNNGDAISGVTVDFSAFGGGAAVAALNGAGTWTATYTIVAGAIDGSNKNISVTATDNGGNATTTADTTNATLDNQAPTVTDGNISISGATGTGGAFKIGDTVTATWNNTPGGDNNGDAISSVMVDFSQFGGSAAVTAANAGDTWTAAFIITSGAIDAANRNILVTATDNGGNATTTADTSDATVDSQAPTVTDANISISGATGTGGAYKIGDTVTMSWNNTVAGDNNSDTISSVTADFSQFGGSAAVAATNAAGIWTAASTIGSATVDAANRNVSVTATDNAGNATMTADTSNATVDSQAPTVTDANISISGATGTGGAFKVGGIVTMSWDNTAAGDNNDDISAVTVDFSQFGGGAAVAAINSADIWTAAYIITEDGGGSIDATNRNVSVTGVDDAGNSTTTSDSTNATVDNDSPAVPSTPDMADLADTGSSSTDNITNNVSPTFGGTGDANSDLTLNSSLDGAVGTATSGANGAWSVTPTLLAEGTHNITATAADASGNTSTSPALVVVIDTTVPVLNGMPANILANTDPGQATAVVSWTEPTVTDNVDSPLLPTALSAPTPGLANGSAFPLGATTMTFQATDSAGNSSSAASFMVTVVDNEPPVFSGVPADITVSTPHSSGDTAIVTWTTPTATDNVDGAVIPVQTAGPPSGSEFPVGTTTITYTATDTQGNSSTASFIVVVKQAKFPWWILLPALVSPNKVSGAAAP